MEKIKKLVVLDGYTENPGDLSWEAVSVQAEEFVLYDRTEPAEILSRIGDADAVLTNKTPITAETIAACPRLRYIGVLATGYNIVDTPAAAKAGITVTNIPSYGTDAVAQYTMALLLELCHHVGAHSDSVRNGEWSRSKDFCYWHYPLTELVGKTLGVIGFGRIGQAVASLGRAFGMKTLAYDPGRLNGEPETEFVSLEELLSRSDVVTLHCPLTAENTGLISRERIARMKDGALLLNTARGPLLDEQAAADALRSGKLGGVAADVCCVEPVLPENPLLTAPNCILTPHIAWAAKESRARLMAVAAENLFAYRAGHPRNVV